MAGGDCPQQAGPCPRPAPDSPHPPRPGTGRMDRQPRCSSRSPGSSRPHGCCEATVAAAIKGMPATAVGAMANLMLRSLLLARLGMTAAVLAIALMTAGFGLALRGAPASQDRQRSETTPRADTTARIVSKPIDRRADPLPEHARLRIGGTRFNHGISIGQVLYTPDGKSLVAIDRAGAVLVWDAATGRMVRAIGGPPIAFRDIALSPDGLTLATLEDSGQLRLWDLASGRERRRWHAIPGFASASDLLARWPDPGRGAQHPIRPPRRRSMPSSSGTSTSPTEHRRRFAADWRGPEGPRVHSRW